MTTFKKHLSLVLIVVAFPILLLAKNELSAVKKLSTDADIILIGKVTKIKSAWNENKTRIFTKATLKVDEFLKGNNNDSTVEVVYPGGEVGDVGEIYTHMPKFAKKEDVLVFLKKDKKKKIFRVLNGEEGKIMVIQDTKTNEKITDTNVRIDALKSQIKSIVSEQIK